MKSSDIFVIVGSLVCMSAALFFSFWPLAAMGVAFLVLYGHTAWGIGAGLFFDAVYGAPVGMLAILHFPFLLFAVVCVGLRILAIRQILPRNDLGAL